MIKKEILVNLYSKEKKSVREIAETFKCSEGKINYWIQKYHIKKRTISEAIYAINNPHGDPFVFHEPENIQSGILYGIGLGIYWGEGTKRNKNSVRLGNTDPKMINVFVVFLERFFSVNRLDMKFGIQVFSDMTARKCEKYWIDTLCISQRQLYKTIITPTRGDGTYRRKMAYGVMTVYYNNTKLQELLCKKIDDITI